MDAETKEYLDSKFGEIITAMNAWSSRLERRPGTPEDRREPTELEDRVLSLEERFRTMKMRMEQLDRRVTDRLDARSFR